MFLGEYSFRQLQPAARLRSLPLASALTMPAGAQYQTNIQAAAHNPWCVGVAWFEYATSRSRAGFLGETDLNLVEGEDYAFGMVDVADRPKYDLVNQVRAPISPWPAPLDLRRAQPKRRAR